MGIESLVVIQVEAQSEHSTNVEGEQVAAAAAAVAVVAAAAAELVEADSEPTDVDELILQAKQVVQFVCEVTVPTNSGPKLIGGAAAAAAAAADDHHDGAPAAAQPVLELGPIHFESHFDRWKMLARCWQHWIDSTAEDFAVAADEGWSFQAQEAFYLPTNHQWNQCPLQSTLLLLYYCCLLLLNHERQVYDLPTKMMMKHCLSTDYSSYANEQQRHYSLTLAVIFVGNAAVLPSFASMCLYL